MFGAEPMKGMFVDFNILIAGVLKIHIR